MLPGPPSRLSVWQLTPMLRRRQSRELHQSRETENSCGARLADWDCRARTCPREIHPTKATKAERRLLLHDTAVIVRVRDPARPKNSKPAEKQNRPSPF